MTAPRSVPRPVERLSKKEDGCLAFFLSLVTWPVVAIVEGFTILKLWRWFVVPTFHLSPLSMAAAIGLGMLVTFVTFQESAVKRPEGSMTEVVLTSMVSAIFRSVVFLAFGAVVHAFM